MHTVCAYHSVLLDSSDRLATCNLTMGSSMWMCMWEEKNYYEELAEAFKDGELCKA
jgi:hypothetical protein